LVILDDISKPTSVFLHVVAPNANTKT